MLASAHGTVQQTSVCPSLQTVHIYMFSRACNMIGGLCWLEMQENEF